MPDVALDHFDWIASHAMRRADALAAIDLATGRRSTYAQFHARIDGIAAGLAERHGVGPGDRVAVLAHGSTDVFELQFACFRLGAIFTPLNIRLAQPELAAILANCAPALLVHDQAHAARAAALTGPAGPRLLATGEGSDFEALATSGRSAAPAPARLADTCTLLYTSGTTGLPKGVIVTHAMNLFNAFQFAGAARITDRSVHLSVLPLFHTGGLNVYANPVFFMGGTVAVMASFDPAEKLRLIDDPALGITHLFGAPAHYQFAAQLPAFATTDFSRIITAGVGAAPTPLSLIEAWQGRGVPLTQGYGMTETGPLVLYLDQADSLRKAGSAGKPVMYVAVRLVGVDGSEAATGEVGEIWVRGPAITPGYWRNAAATEAAFADGWLRTGDAAHRDAEGYVFIVDRWKDMYISGGENVYPAEVENVLYRHPAIAEAAVIGVASARWGETGRAIVALKQGTALDAPAVIAHCAASLARYKLPQSVVFIDALPRNAAGKVHKPSLRQAFGEPAEI
ncbi:long-chain fatty acid--CoA ligase [Sphingomonas sp.]|uniref:acyl-CoA synthetase n=1 Tax=Sphingomonas sp. TaxID=28214 RepID=UPI0035ADDA37